MAKRAQADPVAETFALCVHLAFANKELMHEYRRLTGSRIGLDGRSPLARMIDEATGHDEHEAEYVAFLDFVRDCIWSRWIGSMLADPPEGLVEK